MIVPQVWNSTLWVMRIAAPVLLCASLHGCWWAWGLGNKGLLAINAALAGINLILTWIEWSVFQPNKRKFQYGPMGR